MRRCEWKADIAWGDTAMHSVSWFEDAFEPLWEYYLKFDYVLEERNLASVA